MLSISKKKQYLKTNEELSGMLVAKNAPIRNYSTCITLFFKTQLHEIQEFHINQSINNLKIKVRTKA